jgi:hypothetical protein
MTWPIRGRPGGPSDYVRLRGRGREGPTAEGRKETPAVGDLTAGALSRRSIRRGREGEPRQANRLMRKHCVDNYRGLKFPRCDIFAKVRFSDGVGCQCERRWTRAE